MTLESWQYGNPEHVLQRKQELAAHKARQCGACIHHTGEIFKGETVIFCKFKRHVYGVRCNQYQTKGTE